MPESGERRLSSCEGRNPYSNTIGWRHSYHLVVNCRNEITWSPKDGCPNPDQGVLDLSRGELRIGVRTVILSENEEHLEVRLKTIEEQEVPPWTEGVIHLDVAHGAQETLPRVGLVQ